MVCSDCGDAISVDKMCKTPLQSATNMLKHMAVHNASRAFASLAEHVAPPEADNAPSAEPSPLAIGIRPALDRFDTSVKELTRLSLEGSYSARLKCTAALPT
jgi:hypothetical protein